jgi:formylmethanofuran dehydrogenase subunit E-like metal-binding protein
MMIETTIAVITGAVDDVQMTVMATTAGRRIFVKRH